MARIDVEIKETKEGWESLVRVSEGAGTTTHLVSFSKITYERLTKGRMTPEELVRRSFEFLLAREPKESILRDFDLADISRYFPRFVEEFRRTLPG